MKCSHCSHENAPDFLFCENCGEPLKKECSECGHENGLDFAFCENCGTPLIKEAIVPEEESPAVLVSSENHSQKATAEAPQKISAFRLVTSLAMRFLLSMLVGIGLSQLIILFGSLLLSPN